MEKFPNLQKADVILKKNDRARVPMSTEEMVLLFQYLLHLPQFSVGQIRVENTNDILMGIQGKNRWITSLKLSYSAPPCRKPDFLTIKTCPNTKGRIIINVSCNPQTPPFLPHIGLIEQSGENLKYLEIDMCSVVCSKKTKVKRLRDGVAFSSFLLQCPRLLGIRVSNTTLSTFGEHIQFQKSVKIREYIRFSNVTFHPSFLPSMTLSVSYISQFTLSDCTFDELPQAPIREIDLSNTVFHNILYEVSRMALCKAYLKLTKTINNKVYWYVTGESGTFRSTEKEYEKSLRNTSVLSLSIQCQDISSVTIRIPKVNTILNF